jgi:hypothetical protein
MLTALQGPQKRSFRPCSAQIDYHDLQIGSVDFHDTGHFLFASTQSTTFSSEVLYKAPDSLLHLILWRCLGELTSRSYLGRGGEGLRDIRG